MSKLDSIKEIVLLRDLPSDLLKELQTLLKKLYYYTGTLDGLYGDNTRRAWHAFKTDHYQTELDAVGPGSVKLLLKAASTLPSYTTSVDWTNPKVRISRYFTVGDVTKGDQERVPKTDEVKRNVIALAKELDKVREAWGGPIGVTSWYRPPAVNRRVGGAKNSQHINGSAADIFPIGGDIYKFQSWLDHRWDKALGYGARKGFCHLDLRPGRIRWNY